MGGTWGRVCRGGLGPAIPPGAPLPASPCAHPPGCSPNPVFWVFMEASMIELLTTGGRFHLWLSSPPQRRGVEVRLRVPTLLSLGCAAFLYTNNELSEDKLRKQSHLQSHQKQ